MGKRGKRTLKFDPREERDVSLLEREIGSSDDEEANADLTLRIIEKAKRVRDENGNRVEFITDSSENGGSVSNTSLSSTCKDELRLSNGVSEKTPETQENDGSEKNVNQKIRKSRAPCKTDDKVNLLEDNKDTAGTPGTQAKNLGEPSTEEKIGNILFRKLLRGWRYFDPQENGWEACYSCGEGGHLSVSCPHGKRKKPCFVCGSLEHISRNCTKELHCFICGRSGHKRQYCPSRDKNGLWEAKTCLNCGDPGHDMLSCGNDYSHEDLRKIKCYVCNRSGHLSCGNHGDGSPPEFSCYQCGQVGHEGLVCTRSSLDGMCSGPPICCCNCGEEGHFSRGCMIMRGRWSPAELTDVGLPTLCYKCGLEGHFARVCPSKSLKRMKGTPDEREFLQRMRHRSKGTTSHPTDLRDWEASPSWTSRRHRKVSYSAPSKSRQTRSSITMQSCTVPHRGPGEPIS